MHSNNRKLKIGFFTKDLDAFYSHVKPFIDSAPTTHEYEFQVYHINKYYSIKEKVSDADVTFVDLTKHLNFRKLLIRHKPNCMISLNPGNIFDLFFLSICKLLSIITIYYQHGIQLDFTEFDAKKIKQGRGIQRKFNSVWKYIFFYYCFILNTFLNKRKGFLLKTIIIKSKHFLKRKNKHLIPKYGLKENHTDIAFVFGKKEKDYLMNSMQMDEKKIIVSGYPFIEPDEKEHPSKPYLLFFSSALRKVGVIPISIEEEMLFYQTIAEQVINAGFNFVLKLHPKEDLDLFNSYLKNFNSVQIFKYANLASLSQKADIIMGEYTTALFYGIKYYKPILIMESKFFDKYPFDITDYGIGRKITLDKLKEVLQQRPAMSQSNYEVFLKKNLLSENGKSLYWNFYNYINNH